MAEKMLPIGVFWDIENLNVPKYKSAFGVVQRIRDKFFAGYREAEFMCVCDINKESKDVIAELNSASVNVVHIDATGKNAADDKIRHSLRRFSDTHPPHTRLILISGDFNFISDVSDLRHRKNYYTILIHGRLTNESLISCANESHVYDDLIDTLPYRTPSRGPERHAELKIHGFSKDSSQKQIHTKLRQLSNNCGGRVLSVTQDYAVLRFGNRESAIRAKKRMDGEKVFGFKITASFPGEETLTSSSDIGNFKKPTTPRKFKSNKDFFEYSCQLDNQENSGRKSSQNIAGAQGTTSVPIDIPGTTHQRLHNSNLPDHDTSFVTQIDYFETPESDKGPSLIEKKCNRSLLMIQQQNYQEKQSEMPYRDFHNRDYRPCSAPTRNSPSYIHPNMGGSPNAYYRSSPSNRYSAFSPSNHNTYQNYNNSNYYGSSPNRLTANTFQPISGSYMPNGSGCIPNNNGYMVNGSGYMPNGYLTSGCGSPGEYNTDGPVELVVSNLDYNISAKEWRKILFTTFHPQVKVLSVHIKTQPDNTCIGMIKIPTVDEARFAISQFHRKKIGYKRIQVTLKNDDVQMATTNLRMEAIALLTEANGNILPLFKFIELFDKRYRKNITTTELYKMKDIIEIRERVGIGKYVCLAPSQQQAITRALTPSNIPSGTPTPIPDSSDVEIQEILEPPVCTQHCPEGSVFYAEAMNCSMLPNVKLHLKPFSANVHTLLLSHNGSLPLASFIACYAAEFSPLVAVKESGVPLEHLISCIPGIEIFITKIGMKKVQWSENPSSSSHESPRCSPSLSQGLIQIGREIVELLKNSPNCRMPVSKFVPSFHHQYGRQCRVADYGYTKLMELFEAIPYAVQVLGIGGRRMITLSHKSQVQRFSTDLLHVLQCHPGKVVDLEDFPVYFARVFGTQFDVTQYGACYLEDIIHEVTPAYATIYQEAERIYISLPRRDQAPEEIERTKQFALEVYDLLKHNQCRMIFTKFIPAYHHHFGRQCKVADYGFTKLSDLFEAISHVVEMEDGGEEREIRLTLPEMRKVLSEQITEMLKQRPGQCIPLHELMPAFMMQFGFTPRFEDLNVECLKSMLTKLRHIIKVEVYNNDQYVVLLRHTQLPPLALQVLQLLMDQSSGSLPFVELCSWYRNTFNVDCDMKQIREELLDYVQVSGDDNSAVISLTPLQTLARDIRLLLIGVGKISLDQLESAFQDTFGVEIKPALYGFPSLQALLYALPHIVTIRGRGSKKILQLSKQLKVPSALQQAAVLLTGGKLNMDGKNDSDTPSNDSGVTDTHEDDLLVNEERVIMSPIDLLCSGAIPSAVPSPQLHPASQTLPDLMSFTTSPDKDFLVLTEDEKRNLKSPLCQTPTSQILQFAAQYLPETKDGSPIPPQSQTSSPVEKRVISRSASPIPILGQRMSKDSKSTSPVMRLLQGALTPRPIKSCPSSPAENSHFRPASTGCITKTRLSPAQMNLWTRSCSRSRVDAHPNSVDIQQGSRNDTLDVPEYIGDEKSSEFGDLLKGGWWKASQTQLEEVNKTFKLSSESWSGRSSPAAPSNPSGRTTPNVINTDTSPNPVQMLLTNGIEEPKAHAKVLQSKLSIALKQNTDVQSKVMAKTDVNAQGESTNAICTDLDTTLDQSCDTTLDSEMSYNLLFKRGHPLDTSSVRSDTPRTSPRKPRRPRLAAKFNIPLEPSQNSC